MRVRTKVYIILMVFFSILLSYLPIVYLFPQSSPARLSHVCQSVPANCIVLVFFSFVIAVGLAEIIGFCFKKSIEIKWRRSKLGGILVSEGYVTEEELRKALTEQGLRIGEVLIRAGRITAEQLDHALNHQRKVPGKLGEILKDLAYSTDEDINWAINRSEERLGEIFLKKGVLTDYDLSSSLALQRYGPRWIEKAWDGKITIH